MNKLLKVLKEVISTSLYILCILVLTWLVITFVCQKTVVIGTSMNNMLQEGDQIIVDKVSYRFHEPERFDIVVFPYKQAKDTYYIKRVIGLPGETVQIDDSGAIYIDGEVLTESYGMEVMKSPGRAAEPVTLGAGEYFVLGDNRNDSQDSRDMNVGNVKKSKMLGKAWLRVWPFNSFGVLKHQ